MCDIRATMNILTALLRRARAGETPPDPITLDASMRQKYESWEAGFHDYDKGVPFEMPSVNSRSRPLWRQGWLAAKRIDELIAEQKTTLESL